MAKSLSIAAMTVVTLLILLPDGATAQQPRFGRPSRPTTSPYLNLLRRSNGGGFAFNYFQRLRPEMEFRRNAAVLGRSINSLSRQMQQQKNRNLGGGLGQTGHSVTFLNLGGYFSRGFGRSGSQFGRSGSPFGQRR